MQSFEEWGVFEERREDQVLQTPGTNLVAANFREEECAWGSPFDVGEQLVRSGRKGDIISLVGQATTASEEGDEAAFPVEDNRARVPACGEGATTAAIRHNGGFVGRKT